jgi:hypothetical protein
LIGMKDSTESSSWSLRIVLSLKKVIVPVTKVMTEMINPMRPNGPEWELTTTAKTQAQMLISNVKKKYILIWPSLFCLIGMKNRQMRSAFFFCPFLVVGEAELG